jgi:cyclopropane fatty-acyl-phospholipid synthase-like methyltransferase
MNVANQIIQLNEPAPVSMADSWFEHGTPDHFWVRHRNAVLDRHFKKIIRSAEQIGEVGCGSGLILHHLNQAYQKAADGFELNLTALNHCPKLPGDLYIYDILRRHPKLTERYEVLLMMDVLEHIENETEFLEAVGDHLKPDGHLIIGVPMRQHLYSAYDAAAGHYRRYSTQHLKSVVQASGFTVKEVVQWGHVYIPLLMVRKMILKNISGEAAIKQGFATSPLMNQLLSLLRYLDFVIPNIGITGTSAFLLAQKR